MSFSVTETCDWPYRVVGRRQECRRGANRHFAAPPQYPRPSATVGLLQPPAEAATTPRPQRRQQQPVSPARLQPTKSLLSRDIYADRALMKFRK